jgi:membrane protease YdiL (CAAX protease family)
METKKITLNTLVFSAAAVFSIELAARVAISQGGLPPLIGLGLARLVQICFMLMFIRLREKNFDSIGIAPANTSAGLKKGVIWSLCFGLAVGLLFIIFLFSGINVLKIFQTSIPFSHKDIFLFFSVGAVIGPIAEEIFFRGIIYGFFRQSGFTIALILSTALFVFPHLAGPGIPLTQVVGGLLFAVAYEVEKNLIVPIVIHSLGNLAIFSLSFIA